MCVTMRGLVAEVDDRRIGCAADSPRSQLVEHEHGECRKFDADVRPLNSFTGDVMRVMASISYGEIRTYGKVTAELDSHAVAVGQARGRSPVLLVILYHRVAGAGSLGDFSVVSGIDPKRALPDRERGAIQIGLDRSD